MKRLRDNIPMFGDLPDSALKELLFAMVQEVYVEGETIFEPFSGNDSSVNFLLSGRVRVDTFVNDTTTSS